MAAKPTTTIKKAVPQIKARGLLSTNGEKDDEVIQLNTPELGLLQHLLQNRGRVNPKTGLLSFAEGGGPGSGSHDSNHGDGGGSTGGGGGSGGGGSRGGTGTTAGGGSQSSPEGAGGSMAGGGVGGGANPAGPPKSPVGLGAALGNMFGSVTGQMSQGLDPNPAGLGVDDRGIMDRVHAFFSGLTDVNRKATDDPTFNGFLSGIGLATPGFNVGMGITRGLQDATGSMGTPGLAHDQGNAAQGGHDPSQVSQTQQQNAINASTGVPGNIPANIPSLGLLGQYQPQQQQWTVPGYGFQTPGYGFLQWGQK